MKEKLLALYDLQQIDTALDAIKRQYAAQDRGQEERAHYDTAKAAHDEALAALQAAETNHKDTQLEHDGVITKHKEVETKLYSGKVSNPKDLQFMQEEVEMLARNRERLDEKLTSLLADVEACRAREKAAKKTLSEAIKAYNVKASASQAQSATFKGQAETLTEQRNTQAKEIAPDLLKRYEKLRTAKNGIGIVSLQDGNACGGCKMGLSRDTMLRVREGKVIVICENCERMLADKR